METEKSGFTAADFRRRACARAIPLACGGDAEASQHFRGDHDLNPDLAEAAAAMHRKLRLAAVLVPVVDRGAAGASVILTLRAAHLSAHAGQISFPGGKVMTEDASIVDAALRESMEEIGLTRDHIEPLGLLDTYHTGTGFRVVPVLSVVSPGFTLTIDTQEVAEVFEVPLEFLMTPENHQRHSVILHGRARQYYAMPYGERYIWGATAGILRAMYERLYTE